LCPEILGTNSAASEISNFGQVVDGGGSMDDGEGPVPLEQGEKEAEIS
jgi:hypothetical protein